MDNWTHGAANRHTIAPIRHTPTLGLHPVAVATTNKKSYMVYRTAPVSMTLNDHYPRFQGHSIFFDAEYLRNGTKYRQSQLNTNKDLHTSYDDTKHRAVCLRQLSFLLYQTGKRRHYVLDLSVRPSVQSFVRLLLSLWIRYFWNKWTDFDARAWNDQLWGPRGQRSRSHKGEDRFGGLAEVSFLTLLGCLAVLVYCCRCSNLFGNTIVREFASVCFKNRQNSWILTHF